MNTSDINSTIPFLELVNQHPCAVLIVDHELNICFANTSAEHTFHTEASELQKLSLNSLNQSAEALADLKEKAQLTLEKQRSHESKAALMSGAGLRYYRCTLQPLVDLICLTLQDITEQVQAETNLRTQSTHDPLTGLFNRQQLFAMGSHDIARSKRYGYPISLLVINIDNIRHINQTYGYSIGDFVLISVAKVLQEMLRESDYVARLDNKSFVISLLDATLEQTETIANRIKRLISNKDVMVANIHIPIKIMIGAAQYQENKDHHFDDLLLRAENNSLESTD